MSKKDYKNARGNGQEDFREDIEPIDGVPVLDAIIFIFVFLFTMGMLGYLVLKFFEIVG